MSNTTIKLNADIFDLPAMLEAVTVELRPGCRFRVRHAAMFCGCTASGAALLANRQVRYVRGTAWTTADRIRAMYEMVTGKPGIFARFVMGKKSQCDRAVKLWREHLPVFEGKLLELINDRFWSDGCKLVELSDAEIAGKLLNIDASEIEERFNPFNSAVLKYLRETAHSLQKQGPAVLTGFSAHKENGRRYCYALPNFRMLRMIPAEEKTAKAG